MKIIKKILVILLIIVLIAALIGTFSFLIMRNNYLIQRSNIIHIDINNKTVNDFNELFATSTNEFVICLNGKIKDNTAFITDYYSPDSFKGTGGDITFVECDKYKFLNPIRKIKFLGTIHNHPNGICSLSFTDTYTFGKSDDALIGVICGEDNIKIFTPQSLIKSIV